MKYIKCKMYNDVFRYLELYKNQSQSVFKKKRVPMNAFKISINALCKRYSKKNYIIYAYKT